MSISTTKPSKGFFIPELILTILAGICLAIAAGTMHDSIKLLDSGKAAGIIGSVLILSLYMINTIAGVVLTIPVIVLGAIGIKKYDKATSQIVLLVFAAVILVALVALFAATISHR